MSLITDNTNHALFLIVCLLLRSNNNQAVHSLNLPQ